MPRDPHLTTAQQLLEGCERSINRVLAELALADAARERPELHNRADQLLTDLTALLDELNA